MAHLSTVHVNSFSLRNGVPEVHPVSRTNRMEVRHSRTPSFPSLPRPSLGRRGSNASEAGSVMTSASELTEHPHQPSNTGQNASGPQQPATPLSISVPPTPSASAGMNPPPSSGKASSRRSSFSSQQAASPALSVTALGRGRSPSPIPPLPAMRQVAPPASITQRLYAEENVTRFFRRLTFSPDGSLLLTPAGQIEDQIFKGSPMMGSRSLSHDGVDGNPAANRPKAVDAGRPTVFIYSRANLARSPIAHLPGHKTAAVAIRFSPIFYDLRTASTSSTPVEPKQVTLDRSNPGPVHVSLQMPPPPPKEGAKDTKPLNSVFALPYRLLYAVACQDAVLLYDTQQAGPVAIFKGLHYAGFTDIAWSPDGQSMLLSSADGYCSLVVFDLGELGTVHPTQQHHRQLAAIAQSHGGATPSTPMPHSPNVSTMRTSPAPPRSERESSVASSAPIPPPLFGGHRPASGSVSSVDQPLPTPADEPAEFALRRASESSADDASTKREPSESAEQPKKKRRVALTHLGTE